MTTEHWMISYIVGLSPKVVFKDGQFIFTEEEAKAYIKELRTKYPTIEFHLSKGGEIQKETEEVQ